MAFGAKIINPLDTRPGVGIGVSLPFNGPGVFTSTYTTKDAIRNNLINYFLTNKTERYLNINFGSDLRSFIFQQITTNNTDTLKEDIQFQVNTLFPQITLETLEVNTEPDNNQINILFKYSINNTGLTDTLNITFT